MLEPPFPCREGSSPLARGLREDPPRRPGAPGIIPARAGFTRPPSRSTRDPWDHPRSRGVYNTVYRDGIKKAGSSPLARGLRVRVGGRRRRARIIPARAGFTSQRCLPGSRRQDHPRSRGVYGRSTRTRASWDGSSPLARGLLHRRSHHWERGRIIPARAGFTPGERRGPGSATDHPRSRGVYGPRAMTCAAPGGSSPLARGLPDISGGPPGVAGIIPARAGFTLWRVAPT